MSKNVNPMKRLHVQLPEQAIDSLKEITTSENLAMASLLRKIILDWLDEHEKVNK